MHDFALPEGIVKRVVDRLGSDAQARCRIAIDFELYGGPGDLLVGRDIAQQRDPLQRLEQDRSPVVELVEVGVL
jgi:hypothetical protein